MKEVASEASKRDEEYSRPVAERPIKLGRRNDDEGVVPEGSRTVEMCGQNSGSEENVDDGRAESSWLSRGTGVILHSQWPVDSRLVICGTHSRGSLRAASPARISAPPCLPPPLPASLLLAPVLRGFYPHAQTPSRVGPRARHRSPRPRAPRPLRLRPKSAKPQRRGHRAPY